MSRTGESGHSAKRKAGAKRKTPPRFLVLPLSDVCDVRAVLETFAARRTRAIAISAAAAPLAQELRLGERMAE